MHADESPETRWRDALGMGMQVCEWYDLRLEA